MTGDRGDFVVPELAAHTPLRPLWICRIDACPWPCPDARLNLVTAYMPDRRVELYLYLAVQLVAALSEINTVVVDAGAQPDPYVVHRHIIGWLIAHEARERARRPRSI